MYASELVDSIAEVGGGYYSRQKILARANRAQNDLLGSSCSFMRRWVKLSTVSGTLSYALPTDAGFIRSVDGAYVSRPLPTNTASVPSIKAPVVGADLSAFRYEYRGVMFTPADPVVGGGTITFPSDTMGLDVWLHCTVWPTQMLVETDMLTIPDEFAGLVEAKVLEQLYKRGYGNADNLDKEQKKLRAAWFVFLSRYNENTASRPAWGFTQADY